MEENKELTAERSLEIIGRSIEQSRREMERNAGWPLILWGSLVVVTALVVGHLWEHCGGPVWNLLWFAMTAVGFAMQRWLDGRRGTAPRSFVGKVICWLWLTFAVFAIGMAVLSCLVGCLGIGAPLSYVPLTCIIILLMGFSSTVMGLLIKSGIITGFAVGSCLVGAIYCLMYSGAYEMVMLAIVALLVLVVPGLLIHLKSKGEGHV